MAKANYKFDKRQRDRTKQKKREDKLAKKAADAQVDGGSAPTQDCWVPH